MKELSQLFIRTQTTLRLFASLDKAEQQKLATVSAELNLIEWILMDIINAPEPLHEAALIDVLEDTLHAALDTIANANSEEGAS